MERRQRFERVYRAHGPAIQAYLLRRTDRSTAEEAFADTFAVCWRRADDLPADALPWLIEVSRRVLSTTRRGDRRRAALQQRLLDTAPAQQAHPPGATNTRLQSALESMSVADRELLLLIAWEGFSPAQAARVLHIKPGTLRVRLLRARRRLTHALEQPDARLPLTPPLPTEGS